MIIEYDKNFNYLEKPIDLSSGDYGIALLEIIFSLTGINNIDSIAEISSKVEKKININTRIL